MARRQHSILFIFCVCYAFNYHNVGAFVPTYRQDLLKLGKISSSSSRTYRGAISTPPPTADTDDIGGSTTSKDEKRPSSMPFYKLPRAAYRIYRDYAKRLWKETDVEHRQQIADDQIRLTIRTTQQMLQSNEYAKLPAKSEEARDQLIEACRNMENAMKQPEQAKANNNKDKTDTSLSASAAVAAADDNKALESAPAAAVPAKKEKKPRRSVLLGALMGAAVACWVFSGNYVFTGVFTLMTILGQLEYYRMVMNTGVYPARRISVVGACSMFLTALFAPELHQICLPMFGLYTMIWFLGTRRNYSTIPEIATTFTGMFYLGYVPSFWVRTRLIGSEMEPTRLFTLLAPMREYLKSKFGFIIPDRFIVNPMTSGAVFVFWSWLSLAFSDVGAYFVGRKFGNTKLGEIAPAAGSTSPNKSVEGVIGGCAVSAVLSIIGAWVQKWPYFVVTGAIHGIMIGLLGLIGDLTASMLKRDAGLKDFGDLIPEHGGILDRVDSFVWTAPYSWIVFQYIIPALKAYSLR